MADITYTIDSKTRKRVDAWLQNKVHPAALKWEKKAYAVKPRSRFHTWLLKTFAYYPHGVPERKANWKFLEAWENGYPLTLSVWHEFSHSSGIGISYRVRAEMRHPKSKEGFSIVCDFTDYKTW